LRIQNSGKLIPNFIKVKPFNQFINPLKEKRKEKLKKIKEKKRHFRIENK